MNSDGTSAPALVQLSSLPPSVLFDQLQLVCPMSEIHLLWGSKPVVQVGDDSCLNSYGSTVCKGYFPNRFDMPVYFLYPHPAHLCWPPRVSRHYRSIIWVSQKVWPWVGDHPVSQLSPSFNRIRSCLRSTAITAFSSLLCMTPPLCSVLVLWILQVLCLTGSLNIGTTASQVPYQRLIRSSRHLYAGCHQTRTQVSV